MTHNFEGFKCVSQIYDFIKDLIFSFMAIAKNDDIWA